MSKCESFECLNDAVVRLFWPGRTITLCRPCLDRARWLAAALGFTVEYVPLEETQCPTSKN